jgi:hypothetical protein
VVMHDWKPLDCSDVASREGRKNDRGLIYFFSKSLVCTIYVIIYLFFETGGQKAQFMSLDRGSRTIECRTVCG